MNENSVSSRFKTAGVFVAGLAAMAFLRPVFLGTPIQAQNTAAVKMSIGSTVKVYFLREALGGGNRPIPFNDDPDSAFSGETGIRGTLKGSDSEWIVLEDTVNDQNKREAWIPRRNVLWVRVYTK